MEYTSRNAQNKVFDALLNGERLTVQECFHRFHTTELRRIISRIRDWGHEVKSEKVKGETYHVYYMPKEWINAWNNAK